MSTVNNSLWYPIIGGGSWENYTSLGILRSARKNIVQNNQSICQKSYEYSVSVKLHLRHV